MKFTTNPKQYTWSDLLFSDFQHFLTSGRFKILSQFEIFSFTTVTCFVFESDVTFRTHEILDKTYTEVRPVGQDLKNNCPARRTFHENKLS